MSRAVTPQRKSERGPVRPLAAWDVTDRRLPTVLWCLAGVLLLTGVFYAFVHPLTPVRMDRSSAGLMSQLPLWSAIADVPWPVPRRPAVLAVSLVVMAAVAFAAYALAVVVCWGRRASTRTTLAVGVPTLAFLVLSALALPTQSSDIVDYVLTGRVAAAHGANPHEVAPDAFPDDPVLPYASRRYTDEPQRKPPVWTSAAVALAALAGDDPATAVLVFRFGFLALSLANVALIGALLRRWRPEHALAGVVLYAWNPVVALHGQSRTDTLMAFLALLGAFLLISGHWHASMVSLWLSALVKLLTLPLVAASLVAEVSARRWRRVLTSGALICLVTLVVYLPYARGPGLLLQHLGETQRGGSSLPDFVALPLTVLAAGLVVWVGVTSRDDAERLLQGWALLSLVFALFAPIAWSWYLIAPLALVSLSGEWRKSAAVVALTGLTFLFDLFDRSANARYPLPDLVPFSRAVVFSAVVTCALLVAGALLVWHRRPSCGS